MINKVLFCLCLIIVQQANAGWVGRVCTSIFSKMIVDDPYQYEQAWTEALIESYAALGIKGAWERLAAPDAQQMNVLGGELRWRLGPVMSRFETPENMQKIADVLDQYEQFEGFSPGAKSQLARNLPENRQQRRENPRTENRPQ